jgi:quercetin dioxygenase-like cupin family protein
MKALKTLSALSVAVLWPAAALAQDAVKVDPAHYTVLLENASVRVLKIGYPVGSKSVMHSHPDAIVVPLVSSKVQFTLPDGKTQDNDLPAESAMYTPAATHNPANVGKTSVDAILVEFKSKAPGTAALPQSREGMTAKVIAEGPRAAAYRATAAPTFAEPAGSKHDFDQVVIALGDAQMALSIDGKPAKTAWKRGDVAFIGRGIPHESKNTSGKPIDYVIVAIK